MRTDPILAKNQVPLPDRYKNMTSRPFWFRRAAAIRTRSFSDTALVVARARRAHLAFFDLRVNQEAQPCDTHHISALRAAKRYAECIAQDVTRREQRSTSAERRIRDFCANGSNMPTVAEPPASFNEVSASWHEEGGGDGEEPFITRARLHDLLVMGRFTRPNGLPPVAAVVLVNAVVRPYCGAAGAADVERHRDVAGRPRASLPASSPPRCRC